MTADDGMAARKTIPGRILQELTRPFRKARRLYQKRVLKDPFLLGVEAWFSDAANARRLYDYPLSAASVVLDIGGYQGDYAAQIHRDCGCRVYLFEPSREFLSECQARFLGNDAIRLFNVGLSDRDGAFFLSDNQDGSAISADGAAGGAVVSVRQFSSMMRELELEHVDLVKINIEGAEYDLLEHMIAAGWAERAQHILVQFHNFAPDAARRRQAIREKLARTHDCDWCFDFVWESWRRRASPAAAAPHIGVSAQ